MTTSATPRELPIVGGHLALDFANTVDDPLGPARHDHVSTYDDLVAWSLRVGDVSAEQAAALRGLADQRPRRASTVLRSAHELREALNEVFGAVAAGGTEEVAPVWPRLRGFAAAARSTAELDVGPEGLRWVWPHTDDVAVVLHPVASAAADLLVSDDLRRVKQCHRCPWLFVDVSKNRSRRWCDMDDCGRAQKIERYVARRAARRRR